MHAPRQDPSKSAKGSNVGLPASVAVGKGVCAPRALLTSMRLPELLMENNSGDDDYFSADLEDDKVQKYWGRFKQPALVLHSGEDEFVPSHIDQEALNKRYREASAAVSPLSGLIPGTGHTVRGDEARKWLAERVAQFLLSISVP